MFVLGKNDRNKIERTAEAMEDPDALLECYRRIQRLLERFSLNANLNVWKTVDAQTTELRLKGLSPSHSARYDPPETTKLRRNGCMQGTRVEVLDKLKAWAENSKSENIYWLNGMAGTGKTTIAYSFCDQLKNSLALAASFFCSRQVKECRDVNLILPTLAYQLARFSRPFQHHLSKAIEKDPDIHTRKIPEQFQKLIVEPLLKAKDTIPLDLVVVIDALDECDNKGGVCQILEVLLSHSTQLPLKFFATSRPEPRILDQMKDGPNRNVPARLYLHDIERSIVSEDIRTYLKLKVKGLSDDNLEALVQQSGVLFIYAATVTLYISGGSIARSAARLKLVLTGSITSTQSSEDRMNILYGNILREAFDEGGLDDSEQEEMRRVLHTVLCAQEPLTIDVIAELLGLGADSVQAALEPLLSVLHLSKRNNTVTTLHKSFPDYMFNRIRSEKFCCEVQGHHSLLARRCFEVIGAHNPPFNICGLESSYVFDTDVADLKQRAETAISDVMFYACRYWGTHLVLAEVSPDLVNSLYKFLSLRLLLWMEVMNLKQC
ncbi:hypothetical protein BDV93DRAFT_166894, partial [Ceratobasidium sp. AG-I]